MKGLALKLYEVVFLLPSPPVLIDQEFHIRCDTLWARLTRHAALARINRELGIRKPAKLTVDDSDHPYVEQLCYSVEKLQKLISRSGGMLVTHSHLTPYKKQPRKKTRVSRHGRSRKNLRKVWTWKDPLERYSGLNSLLTVNPTRVKKIRYSEYVSSKSYYRLDMLQKYRRYYMNIMQREKDLVKTPKQRRCSNRQKDTKAKVTSDCFKKYYRIFPRLRKKWNRSYWYKFYTKRVHLNDKIRSCRRPTRLQMPSQYRRIPRWRVSGISGDRQFWRLNRRRKLKGLSATRRKFKVIWLPYFLHRRRRPKLVLYAIKIELCRPPLAIRPTRQRPLQYLKEKKVCLVEHKRKTMWKKYPQGPFLAFRYWGNGDLTRKVNFEIQQDIKNGFFSRGLILSIY